MPRRRFKQTISFKDRLASFAEKSVRKPPNSDLVPSGTLYSKEPAGPTLRPTLMSGPTRGDCAAEVIKGRVAKPMVEYRAYIIGEDGHFIRVVHIICDDDEAAKESAKQLVDGHDVELGSVAAKSRRSNAHKSKDRLSWRPLSFQAAHSRASPRRRALCGCRDIGTWNTVPTIDNPRRILPAGIVAGSLVRTSLTGVLVHVLLKLSVREQTLERQLLRSLPPSAEPCSERAYSDDHGPHDNSTMPACNEPMNLSAQFFGASNASKSLVSSRCPIIRFVFPPVPSRATSTK